MVSITEVVRPRVHEERWASNPPLKVKKMKNAKSSFFLVDESMWQNKQKLS